MPVQPANSVAERQAKLLAADNRKAEPDIGRILWFPDEHEVRLVELIEQVPAATDDEVHPFYFPPSPRDGLFLPSAMAMIRPDERGKLKLPPGWGDWEDAVEL